MAGKMMFQKRHYDALAKVLKAERSHWSIFAEDQGVRALIGLTRELADLFYEDNPNFSKEKWYKATKVGNE